MGVFLQVVGGIGLVVGPIVFLLGLGVSAEGDPVRAAAFYSLGGGLFGLGFTLLAAGFAIARLAETAAHTAAALRVLEKIAGAAETQAAALTELRSAVMGLSAPAAAPSGGDAGANADIEALPLPPEPSAFQRVATTPESRVGAELRITYQDKDGAPIRRRIKVQQITQHPDGDCAVDAWCFLSKEPRLFIASHMTQVTDAGTGELIDDPAAWFRGEV